MVDEYKAGSGFLKSIIDQFNNESKLTERQKRIIDAAVEVFAAKGYDGASTAEIAQKARVAEGTVFKHFKTKKDLLLRVVSPFFIKFAAPYILKPVKEILTTEDLPLEEILRRIAMDRVSLVESNWGEVRILVQETLRVPELREAMITNIAMGIRGIGEELLRKKMAAGEIREIDPFLVLRAYVGIIVVYVVSKHAFKEESVSWNDEEEIAKLADLIMNGLKPRP